MIVMILIIIIIGTYLMEKTKSLTQPNSYIFTDFLFYTKSSIQVNIFLLQYLSKRIVENTFP